MKPPKKNRFATRVRSLIRPTAAALSFWIVFVLTLLVGAGLTQAADGPSSDGNTAASELSVSPLALAYKLNLEKQTSQIKHFTIANEGTVPLEVTVGAPTDPEYIITSPRQLSPFGGTVTIPAKTKHSAANRLVVDVAFAPAEAARDANATILINGGGNRESTISLSGSVSNEAQGLWVGGFQYISEFQGDALQQSGDPPANLAFGSRAFQGPLAMTFDPHNGLWVSYDVTDNGPAPVVEISRAELATLKRGGRVRPKAVLTVLGPTGTPIPLARSLAFDVAGDLWVGDQRDRAVMEFLPRQIKKSGAPSPSAAITSQDFVPGVIRFDASDDLWVQESQLPYNQSNAVQMWRFAPRDRAASGAANPGLIVNLPDTLFLVDLGFDNSGNMWIAGSTSHGDAIEMFSAGDLGGTGVISPAAAVTITSSAFGAAEAGSCLGGIDFDRSGDLWVSVGTNNADCGAETQVVDFTPSQLNAGGSLSPSVSIAQNGTKTNLFLPGPIRFGPAFQSRKSTMLPGGRG